MDLLIDVRSGEVDTLIPNLVMASMLKAKGVDVAVFLEWRALIAFVEKDFKFSQPVAKHASMIQENAKKMGIPADPATLLPNVKAAGIPVYGCAMEAALSGVAGKVPPEIQLLEQAELTRPIVEAKKIIGGM
jgi:peroxiredoxin family protein